MEELGFTHSPFRTAGASETPMEKEGSLTDRLCIFLAGLPLRVIPSLVEERTTYGLIPATSILALLFWLACFSMIPTAIWTDYLLCLICSPISILRRSLMTLLL